MATYECEYLDQNLIIFYDNSDVMYYCLSCRYLDQEGTLDFNTDSLHTTLLDLTDDDSAARSGTPILSRKYGRNWNIPITQEYAVD